MQNKIVKIKQTLNNEALRKMSQKLIDIYKEKNFSGLQMINSRLFPEKAKPADGKKLFYALIKIFHPDGLTAHKQIFDHAVLHNDEDTINFYFRMVSITLPKTTGKLKGIFYVHTEEYAFDHGEEDMFSDSEIHEVLYGEGIISILSHMFLGNSSKILEPVDLEQIEGELVLSNLDLSDLEGLQFCTGVTNLDLSDNNIDNIFEVGSLYQLEELDLSNNNITDLEPLAGLNNLETLYIDNNQIEDISVLTKLDGLKFVSMTGNPVTSMEDIYKLKENDVIVVYY